MLARGVICRLAADVPKTSTRELSRLSHVLQFRLLSHNALSLPAARALSRACRAALAEHRRSYATAATKPTARVKKDVKKAAAAKKPAKPAAKKTAAKNPPKKTARKPAKKTAAKKAKPKKKAAAKPKPRARKVVTPEARAEAKLKAENNQLKETALLKSPKNGEHITAWNMFSIEALAVLQTGSHSRVQRAEALKTAADKFKGLTPAEKEHYNHLANEKVKQLRADYAAWLRSHTPEQIRLANNARQLLKKRMAAGKTGKSRVVASKHLSQIKDDRLPKRPATAYNLFISERHSSGDFKGIDNLESFKLMAAEWKALNAAEKEKYYAVFAESKAAYESSKQSAYGHT